MSDIEELGELLVTPHDYQALAFHAILREYSRGVRSTLAVLPTGCGKTILFFLVARCEIEEGGRVLVLAHMGNLIDQACNSAPAVGLVPVIERAGEHARPDFTRASTGQPLLGDPLDPKLVVATIQTMKGARLKAWPPGHFSMVIVDEAHHAAEGSRYDEAIKWLKPARVLGVTATPNRTDEQPIVGKGQMFETLAFDYPITDAVEGGWLKRPRAVTLEAEIDISDLRVTGQDLSAEDVDAAILPVVTVIANELKDKLAGRQSLIFTPLIHSANCVADALEGFGLRAKAICGESPDKEQIIIDFKAGRYDHLVNAMLLTEGADFPFVDTAVLLRATKSASLVQQMLGRALRKFPDKPEAIIYGVTWKTFRGMKLVHPVQVFDRDGMCEETLDFAKEIVDSGECDDLMEAVAKAKEKKQARDHRKMKVAEQKARARVVEFDPLAFDPEFTPQQQPAGPTSWTAKATDKQVQTLINVGKYTPAEVSEWTKARAHVELDRLFERMRKGLASRPQLKYLKHLGATDAESMTFVEASAEINRLKGTRQTA